MWHYSWTNNLNLETLRRLKYANQMSKKTIQHGSMAAIHMQSQPSILIGNDMILDSHKGFHQE